MTKQIKTSIQIDARPSAIWDILMDTSKYSEWNPFIKSINGTIEVDQQISIELPTMNFKPIILTKIKNTELKWLGKLWIKGILDGEHRFLLIDNHDGTTTFEHSEIFSGTLVKLFSKSLDVDTTRGFEEMNLGLKKRAEQIIP
jgi:hypothetical protein